MVYRGLEGLGVMAFERLGLRFLRVLCLRFGVWGRNGLGFSPLFALICPAHP